LPVTKPRIEPAVRVTDIDGEAVLYNPNDGLLHYLNHSAALVLDLCDGETTMRQMAEAIADVYEMPLDEIEPQVRTVVRDLRRRRLLVPTRKPTPAPDDGAEPTASTDGAVTAAVEDDTDERHRIRMDVPRSS
jgi:nucleoside-diphosphate-sugar epimerase